VTYKKTQWHLATAIHMTIQNSEGMWEQGSEKNIWT
jgi:hypothetical protein